MGMMMSDTLQATVNTIASECLAVRMRLLNRMVTNIFDDALRPLGIKVSQLNILMVVAKRGPITASDVGRVLHLQNSTMSRNLERIRKREWIEVAKGATARKQVLQLTGKGKRLIEKSHPYWLAAQKTTQEALGKSGATAIKRAADRVWSIDRGA